MNNNILNGERVKTFNIRWGTKQGCLLSLLLFSIVIYIYPCTLWCFDVLKNWFWLGETVPPGASQLLEKTKDSVGSMPSTCKLTDSEPNLYLLCLPIRHYSSALIIPGPGTRQLETTPFAQNLPKLFTLINLELFSLPCLVFPDESPIKAQPLSSPRPCFLPPDHLRLLPCGPARHVMPPASRTCKYNKLLFFGASPVFSFGASPACPSHKRTRTYCTGSSSQYHQTRKK